MADDKKDTGGTPEDVGEGLKYFQKLRQKRKPQYEKMEESIGGEPELLPAQKELKERSTKGSAPFSEAEIKKGYRKL